MLCTHETTTSLLSLYLPLGACNTSVCSDHFSAIFDGSEHRVHLSRGIHVLFVRIRYDSSMSSACLRALPLRTTSCKVGVTRNTGPKRGSFCERALQQSELEASTWHLRSSAHHCSIVIHVFLHVVCVVMSQHCGPHGDLIVAVKRGTRHAHAWPDLRTRQVHFAIGFFNVTRPLRSTF